MIDDHEAFSDLAAAYVLGALTSDERTAFVSHLATCSICQREVASLAPIVEALPQTLDQATLPAGLKARVLAAAMASSVASEPTAQRLQATRSSRWVGWLAAAATLAAVVSGAIAWKARSENARLRGELAIAEVRAASLDRQIAALQATAASAQQTAAVLRAADLGRVELAGQTGAREASGRILWSASQGVVFVATHLPPLPPGKVYQLWVVADKPHSAGIVVPNAAGQLNMINSGPVAVHPKAFALTIEPEGGRPAPTGPMLLVGSNQ